MSAAKATQSGFFGGTCRAVAHVLHILKVPGLEFERKGALIAKLNRIILQVTRLVVPDLLRPLT